MITVQRKWKAINRLVNQRGTKVEVTVVRLKGIWSSD